MDNLIFKTESAYNYPALIKANVLGALKLLEQLLADGAPDAKAKS